MNKRCPCAELFTRSPKNPLLTVRQWPYRANAVFNPGATVFEKQVLLLVRVEAMNGFSHLTVARSKNGETHWTIDTKPSFPPDPKSHPEDLWGIEDPRIVFLEELKEYAIIYTSFSKGGPLVSLAYTKDFKEFRRQGILMQPDNKDACLFPRRFKNRWALLHRPMPSNPSANANIWLSFSPDMKHWGDHRVLLPAREGGWWDANKIGLASQPIETEAGWLLIYHGVRRTASNSLYRVGLALLDLDDPTKVIRRGTEWVFGPQTGYEQLGDVPYVTFPSGAVHDSKTRTLKLYYGAADSSVCLATAKMNDVLDFLMHEAK
jgi:predicted GH43/DUF377 family glycosyl hydrolase